MSRVGRCSVSVALLVSLLTIGLTTTACGDDPPTKELQQAQQAIDEARASGAARYSREEFNAAEDAIKRAQAAVTARDYRQALNDALDARDRAQNASKDTVDKKAKAKVDADRTLHDAALAIVDARAKLRTAETGRRLPRLTLPLRRDIADAETHVQEARTALAHGDYLDVIESLNKSMQRLNDSVKALDAATPTAPRRRLP
jgi:flagellar hook-basal body complex protein FliE